MANAFIGAGIAQGAANVMEYDRGRKDRELRRREAEVRVKQAEDFAPMQKTEAELQLEQLKLQTRQLQTQFFKNQTFDAFRMYEADGDTTHLNSFLQQTRQSPAGGSLFKNVVRVDRLSSQDAPLLAQAGIADAENFLKDPNLAKQFVVTTFADGNKGLVDMEKMYAGTGFANSLAAEQTEMMSQRALAISRLRQGESVERLSALERVAKQMSAELGIPEWEAYERLKGSSSRAQGSELERLAKEIQLQNPGMDYLQAFEQAVQTRSTGSETERAARLEAENSGRDYNEVLQETRRRQQAPTSVKEASEANLATEQLQEAFGGNFYSTDFSDANNRRLAQPFIRTIEKTVGATFSEEDKRTMRAVRQLTTLGGRAGEKITDQETGIIDRMLSGVNAYISDNVTDGKSGVAAYETFRNILRNSLFGSALTKQENAAFDTAVGNLGQQKGPVLNKLNEQMRTIQAQLKSIATMGDETLSHYYVGADQEKIDDIITAIDERINRIRQLSDSKDAPAPLVPVQRQPGATRRPLNEIFGGGQ